MPKPPPIERHPAYSHAIQQMDQALEQNAPADNREMIEIFARHHFGKFWKPRDNDNQPNQTTTIKHDGKTFEI